MSGGDHPQARLHLLITCRVWALKKTPWTRQRAVELGLAGWVRNCPDGRVEVTAEGPRPACEALLVYCEEGPPGAHVEMVDRAWEAPSGEFQGFEVRH